MTGRLIDADAQIEQEKFFAETFKGDFGEQVALHTIEILKNAPTVDAIPVEWVETYMQRFTPITQWAFKGMIRVWREKNG